MWLRDEDRCSTLTCTDVQHTCKQQIVRKWYVSLCKASKNYILDLRQLPHLTI